MKKKIISYIALVTLVSSISLIFIFSDLIKQNELNSEKATIETMLNQMIVNLENNQEARDKARQLFTEDYLNRAGFTKYLISIDKYKDFSENDWKEINGLVDVTAIYLVDHNGVIVEGSRSESLGLDFHDNEELEEFLPIINKTSEENYHIEFDNHSVTNHERKIYLGMALDTEKYSMLQLEIDESVLADYEDFMSVQNYVASIPTKRTRTIFVCDENKDLIAITGTNEQVLDIENKEEVKEPEEKRYSNIPPEKVRKKHGKAARKGYTDMLETGMVEKKASKKKPEPKPEPEVEEYNDDDYFEDAPRFRPVRIILAILSLAGFGYMIYRGFVTGLADTTEGSLVSSGMTYIIIALCMLVSSLLYFIMLSSNNIFAFLLPMLFYLGGGIFAFLQRGDDMQLLIAAVAGGVLAVISLILAITSRGGNSEEDDYDDAFEDDYADEESDN